jgi:hypothetical protein
MLADRLFNQSVAPASKLYHRLLSGPLTLPTPKFLWIVPEADLITISHFQFCAVPERIALRLLDIIFSNQFLRIMLKNHIHLPS